MPIRHMATGATFSPEEVQVLVTAYEGCCKEMGFKPQNDALAQTVARTVLQVAKFGVPSAAQVQKQALLLLRGRTTS
jgi:hypothetical protein